jgi:hypothetical protein
MLVVDDQSELNNFPFVVLNVGPGIGAADPSSVDPRVLNGRRDVVMSSEEVDEDAFAETAVNGRRRKASRIQRSWKGSESGGIRSWARRSEPKSNVQA